MYKVLLVDDERIILEGISSVIDWAVLNTRLIGTARNGIAAYEMIEQEQPDIIISDIRMPGMDGLELVAKVKENFPTIEFILLSGFGEFEYAKTAMRYGVHHYLLKPCNENSISQAIEEVVMDLKEKHQRDRFMTKLMQELDKVLPHAKEQFLKELVTNKTYGQREWNDYRRMFRIPMDDQQLRLLLFELEGEFEFEHLFAIKNIATDIFDPNALLLSTTIGRHVLLLIKHVLADTELFERMNATKDVFHQYYRIDVTMAVSEPGEITSARNMYRQTLECLQHRFYLGEGSLITTKDIIQTISPQPRELEFDEEQMGLLIRTGRWKDIKLELEAWFERIFAGRLDIHTAKASIIPLFMFIVQLGPNQIKDYIDGLAKLDQLNTLQTLREYILKTAEVITIHHYELNRNKHSTIIYRIMEIVKENIGNPQLSLQWVASEMLYMNADYLGKLFRKETGQYFSHYVTKVRMEQAVKQISQSDDVKIFELAERFGFGDNPQYFSQVFKKYTGYTPSEFKRSGLSQV